MNDLKNLWKTFTVPIEKEVTRIDKNGEEITKTRSYMLQFIESVSFMASSLSNLVKNLSGGIHRIKCTFANNVKKGETCGIKYQYCNCFLEYTNFRDDLIEYKCLCCNNSYQQKFDEKLKDWFFNRYKISKLDNNKFILLLWKGVYPYEYMYDSEKVNKTLLPEKESSYSHLNMEAITNADYMHAKRVCQDLEIKNLGEYLNLYVQSDTLLLANAFRNVY